MGYASAYCAVIAVLIHLRENGSRCMVSHPPPTTGNHVQRMWKMHLPTETDAKNATTTSSNLVAPRKPPQREQLSLVHQGGKKWISKQTLLQAYLQRNSVAVIYAQIFMGSISELPSEVNCNCRL
jgi:hypothetical protein